MESQSQIKRIAEEIGNDNLLVVLGATDMEGAQIAVETVTVGDPSFVGPLAGVSLQLPVYHILESTIREEIPKGIYEQEVGIVAMVADVDETEKRFKAIRLANEGTSASK